MIRTEEFRDARGKLVTTRVFKYDDNGRESYVDVDHSQAVGVSVSDIISTVATSLEQAVKAKSAPKGDASAVVNVAQIAKAKGSRAK